MSAQSDPQGVSIQRAAVLPIDMISFLI